MDTAELEVQRLNTKAFIDADPVTVLMHRRVRVSLDSGGYRDTYLPLMFAETVRLIPSTDSTPDVRQPSGRMVRPTFTILGEWNADLQRDDRFEFNGQWYQITTPIRPEHTATPYQRKGDVIRREQAES